MQEVNVNGVQWCTPSLFSRAAKFCFKLRLPFAVWGVRGCGKSTLIAAAARLCKMRVGDLMMAIDRHIVMRIGYQEPQDIGGYPQPGTVEYIQIDKSVKSVEAVKMLLMEKLPLQCRVGDEPILLLLEEIDRVQYPAIFNSLTEILLERSVNGEPLGPNVVIAAAGNGGSDKGTFPLPDAVADRFIHLYLNMEGPEAFESWAEFTLNNGGNPAMVRYFQADAGAWAEVGSFDKTKIKDYAQVSARSVTKAAFVSRQLALAQQQVSDDLSDLKRIILSGIFGYARYQKFVAFELLDAKCPPRAEVFAKPGEVAIVSDPSVLLAFGWDLCGFMEKRQKVENGTPSFTKDLGALIQYVLRWPEEQRASMFSMMERRVKSTLLHPAYEKVLRSRRQ